MSVYITSPVFEQITKEQYESMISQPYMKNMECMSCDLYIAVMGPGYENLILHVGKTHGDNPTYHRRIDVARPRSSAEEEDEEEEEEEEEMGDEEDNA